jgi:hypothetical protein
MRRSRRGSRDGLRDGLDLSLGGGNLGWRRHLCGWLMSGIDRP